LPDTCKFIVDLAFFNTHLIKKNAALLRVLVLKTRFQSRWLQAANTVAGITQTKKTIILRMIDKAQTDNGRCSFVQDRRIINRVSDNEIRHVGNETRSRSLLCIHSCECRRLVIQLYFNMCVWMHCIRANERCNIGITSDKTPVYFPITYSQ